MEKRVNFLVDGLYIIKIWWKDANIKKCYLQCAHTHTHTQAQEIAPVQMSPTVSNSHDIVKMPMIQIRSHSHT